MTILRALARTMLASYFVARGLKAWRHPEDFTEAVEPLADKALSAASTVLPRQLAVYLPTDAAGLARTCGAAQVVGGLALATGLCRRLGAGVLTISMVPEVLAANPLKVAAAERTEQLGSLSKSIALLGGVGLAAMDTEGKPDLAWRARAQREAAARATAESARREKRRAKRLKAKVRT